jgi:hypothetical protein
VIKVESCTNLQHFRWAGPKSDSTWSWRRERPEPKIGPVKLTIGDMVGKVSSAFSRRGAMLRVLDGDLWRDEIGSRLVALVPDDKGWNDILFCVVAGF